MAAPGCEIALSSPSISKGGTFAPREPALVELVEQARTGDPAALERLLVQLHRLRRKMAGQYSRAGVSQSFLYARSAEAIWRALPGCDPEKVPHLLAYFSTAIRHELLRAIEEETNLVSVPDHSRRQVRQLNRAEARLTQGLQRTPDLDELANATGLRVPRIRELRERPRVAVRLDHLVRPGDEMKQEPTKRERFEKRHADAFDAVSDSRRSPEDRLLRAWSASLREVQGIVVREAIAQLTLVQREVVGLRFLRDGDELSWVAIGRQLGLTGEGARKRTQGALADLRTILARHPAFEERARLSEERAHREPRRRRHHVDR